MTVSVRATTVADLDLVRSLRLAALADAPEAFARTHAEEAAYPDSVWRARIESNAAGDRTSGFLAVVDGREEGLAVGVLDPDEPDFAELSAMWVAPAARGRGAARALVEAVCAWAVGRGCREVRLRVRSANEGAVACYRACRFEETGRRPDGEIEMVRSL